MCPLAEYLIIKMKSYYHFEKNPLALNNAHLALPDRAGYGIELDEAKIEDRKLVKWA